MSPVLKLSLLTTPWLLCPSEACSALLHKPLQPELSGHCAGPITKRTRPLSRTAQCRKGPCLSWAQSWTSPLVPSELAIATTWNPNKGMVRDTSHSSIWHMELPCTGIFALGPPTSLMQPTQPHRKPRGEDGRATCQGHRVDRVWVPESPPGSFNQRTPFRVLYKQEINYYV